MDETEKERMDETDTSGVVGREKKREEKPFLKGSISSFLSLSPFRPLFHSPSLPLSLSPARLLSLILGLLTLGAVWLGPLPELAPQAFAAHMTMHMGVVAVAAPLIALGVAGGRLDPVRKAPVLFAPIPASLLELVVVWAWHAPALHHAARHSTAGLLAEQGTFLISGLLVWLSAFGGDTTHRASRTAAGVVGLLLTSMHMTLLGALLALAPRPLYPHANGFAGLAPLEDQHLGGAIMLLAGGVSYLLGGLWLTAGLLRGRVLKPGGRA